MCLLPGCLSCSLFVILFVQISNSIQQCTENCHCLKKNLTLNTCPKPIIDYLNIELTAKEIRITCNEMISPNFEDVPSFDAKFLTSIDEKSPLTLESMVQQCAGTRGKRIIYGLNNEGLHSVSASKNILKDNNSVKYLRFVRTSNDANITLLESNFLTYGSQLNTVIFNGLRLVKLANYLQNLSHIETLDLSSNGIEELDDLVFHNLTNLSKLILHNNTVRVLNGNVLQNLTQLRVLDLSYNKIDSLRKDTFVQAGNIQYLNFSNNFLQTIDNNTFSLFAKLERLDLSQNPTLTLKENTFANLTSLKSLNLSGCDIRHIPTGFLKSSPDLIALNVSRNAITKLDSNCFENLKKLAIIDLSYNNISSLPLQLLQPLENLREFLLSRNQLSVFNFDLFTGIQTLGTIDFSDNLISNFTNTLRKFKAQDIILKNNQIGWFPVFLIRNVPGLRHVDLRNNRITSVKIMKDLIPQHVNVEIYLNNNQISQFISEKPAELTNSSNQPNWKLMMDLSENLFRCNCLKYEIEQLVPPQNQSVILAVTSKENICYTSYPNYNCPLIYIENSPKECHTYYIRTENAIVVECTNRSLKEFPVIHHLKTDRYEHSQVMVNLSLNKLNLNGQERLKKYDNVSDLDLSYNNIEQIEWLPKTFKELKLDNNRLKSLSPEVIENFRNNHKLDNVSLKNNPWQCGCSDIELQKYLTEFNNIKINISDVTCEDTGEYLLYAKICDDELALKIATPIVVIGLFIATILAIYFKFNTAIKVYLYSKNWCLWYVAEEELDKDKTYDVFISYSQKDEHFVEKELLPELESGDHPFKVCFHHRDWIPGEFISRQIVNSVLDSRRTMVILSNNFMESVWGKLEFRTAHMQAINEGRARVIVVLFGALNEDSLDDEMKTYLKTNTYVKWGDPWFWSKLKYALPHSKTRRGLSQYSQESFHLR
ncbi:hypothetical protein HUJ04_007240 [Dendroctonus ponderosae]|uniref:TIR domain-containing protein n=1 Tax=Dendroctonus ponderosae TaxID=77166 RepID=A0AAR5PJ16_DENPD|nr:hypothetical protein HUJ04_007240 [Dendroctonus ponderosae]KAH1015932.1 hypothetical protein HUJ04_007240 [Dendroctonus ponderosae]